MSVYENTTTGSINKYNHVIQRTKLKLITWSKRSKKWKRSFKYTLTCPLYTTEHMEGMARIAMIINTESREKERKPSTAGFIDILLTHSLYRITKNEKLANSHEKNGKSHTILCKCRKT